MNEELEKAHALLFNASTTKPVPTWSVLGLGLGLSFFAALFCAFIFTFIKGEELALAIAVLGIISLVATIPLHYVFASEWKKKSQTLLSIQRHNVGIIFGLTLATICFHASFLLVTKQFLMLLITVLVLAIAVPISMAIVNTMIAKGAFKRAEEKVKSGKAVTYSVGAIAGAAAIASVVTRTFLRNARLGTETLFLILSIVLLVLESIFVFALVLIAMQMHYISKYHLDYSVESAD